MDIEIWTLHDSKTSYALKLQIYAGNEEGGSPERMRLVRDLSCGLRGYNFICYNFSYNLGYFKKKARAGESLELVRRLKAHANTLDETSSPTSTEVPNVPNTRARYTFFHPKITIRLISYVANLTISIYTTYSTYYLPNCKLN